MRRWPWRTPTPPVAGRSTVWAEVRTLVFDLSQGPRPQSSIYCYAYDTDAIAGPIGVGPRTPVNALVSPTFTSAFGSFALPDQPACRGEWVLFLIAETAPGLISPLDAGPMTSMDSCSRRMASNKRSSAVASFTDAGTYSCQDRFVVAQITELPAP